jgi:hypothetical protein
MRTEDGRAERAASNQQDPSVLVAIVPGRRDWELVRQEGWYRIPVARAPRQMAVDYLAFYFPGCFGPWRWSVRCYSPVLRFEVLPRRLLLPDEADHPRAGALYYRLQLGPLETLAQPIPSRQLRRVTFLLTTLDRLLNAEELGELWLRPRPQAAVERAYRLGELAPAYGAAA